MNYLDFSREEIIALGKLGFNKNSAFHYDICQEISRGVTYSEIASKFNIAEVKLVRYIKEKKCPDCR